MACPPSPCPGLCQVVSFFFILVLCCLSDVLQLQLWAVALVASLLFLLTDMAITAHEKRNVLSFLYAVYLRMPWAIAPFVVAMFLLYVHTSNTSIHFCDKNRYRLAVRPPFTSPSRLPQLPSSRTAP